MYYQAFEQKIPLEARSWTQYDAAFMAQLFSRVINHNADTDLRGDVLQKAMGSLLDMCLYVNTDAREC
ncbi:MAG: hypothetical protein PHX58_08620 [Desulfovibrio sp.]|jgi:hypothetical protein|nr:hypothetical protein [Desulfovibrio sp.]